MASVDTYNNIKPQINFPPAAYAADIVPVGTDLLGYEGVTAIVFTGVITDGTWTVHLQDSDVAAFDAAGWADVTADNRIGSIPGPFTNVAAGFDNQIYKIGYIGSKRYLRVKVVETVNGTAIIGAIIELGAPRVAPTPTDLNA